MLGERRMSPILLWLFKMLLWQVEYSSVESCVAYSCCVLWVIDLYIRRRVRRWHVCREKIFNEDGLFKSTYCYHEVWSILDETHLLAMCCGFQIGTVSFFHNEIGIYEFSYADMIGSVSPPPLYSFQNCGRGCRKLLIAFALSLSSLFVSSWEDW